MDSAFTLLIDTLIKRFSIAGFYVPAYMNDKAREMFVMYTLESAVILQQESLERLVTSARAVVNAWEEHDVFKTVQRLSKATSETDRIIAGELPIQKLLIICQRGIVQEVVGFSESAYEICDCDEFSSSDQAEGEEYFDGLSDLMQKYLRSTAWNKELPKSRQATRDRF